MNSVPRKAFDVVRQIAGFVALPIEAERRAHARSESAPPLVPVRTATIITICNCEVDHESRRARVRVLEAGKHETRCGSETSPSGWVPAAAPAPATFKPASPAVLAIF